MRDKDFERLRMQNQAIREGAVETRRKAVAVRARNRELREHAQRLRRRVQARTLLSAFEPGTVH
jgi:hypothetical protein